MESRRLLRKTGYQVGTGVMVGLPGQTTANLVHDLEFFKSLDVDMIGMGPYIVHHDTPLGRQFPDAGSAAGRQLDLHASPAQAVTGAQGLHFLEPIS